MWSDQEENKEPPCGNEVRMSRANELPNSHLNNESKNNIQGDPDKLRYQKNSKLLQK